MPGARPFPGPSLSEARGPLGCGLGSGGHGSQEDTHPQAPGDLPSAPGSHEGSEELRDAILWCERSVPEKRGAREGGPGPGAASKPAAVSVRPSDASDRMTPSPRPPQPRSAGLSPPGSSSRGRGRRGARPRPENGKEGRPRRGLPGPEVSREVRSWKSEAEALSLGPRRAASSGDSLLSPARPPRAEACRELPGASGQARARPPRGPPALPPDPPGCGQVSTGQGTCRSYARVDHLAGSAGRQTAHRPAVPGTLSPASLVPLAGARGPMGSGHSMCMAPGVGAAPPGVTMTLMTAMGPGGKALGACLSVFWHRLPQARPAGCFPGHLSQRQDDRAQGRASPSPSGARGPGRLWQDGGGALPTSRLKSSRGPSRWHGAGKGSEAGLCMDVVP